MAVKNQQIKKKHSERFGIAGTLLNLYPLTYHTCLYRFMNIDSSEVTAKLESIKEASRIGFTLLPYDIIDDHNLIQFESMEERMNGTLYRSRSMDEKTTKKKETKGSRESDRKEAVMDG
ncbi:hypothetical protein K435DRAFT_833107 [Dendrothele bispora CBS 962.96]|uniref:Uncharacterized protein n=1 Tax=Dendrothele bispora (strain CBS 962.96) TaxID=1314807 RepID=A0A4S8MZ72_DENBC|nr:hypothetical protein K435DRAFT_833107 [Dendrothele bispora CBS 962.96]